MFGFFKKKNKSQKDIPIENQFIHFKDLKLQDLVLQVKPNGNDKCLSMVEIKNMNEIILDAEQCLFIGMALLEFGKTKKLNETIKAVLIKEGK